MNIDSYGYDYLYDSLTRIQEKLRLLGWLKRADSIRHATKFRTGSPTEFLGESRLALQATLDEERTLPEPLTAEIQELIEAINKGFDRAGYK